MNLPTKKNIQEALKKAGRPLKSKELAKNLKVSKTQHLAFKQILKELVKTGDIYKVKGGRYAPLDQINLAPGMISITRSGVGFLTPDRGGEDIFIPPGGLNTAFEGDRVVVRVQHRGRGRTEGSVVKILERAREQFVGTAKVTAKFAIVSPDDPKLRRDIFVPPDEVGDAQEGDKVQVTITDWGSLSSAPVGRITKVLGKPGDPKLDVQVIIGNYGLEETYPPKVEAWAAKIPETIPAKEIKSRVDLREDQVITIDPKTAKDFDDALSIKPRKDGTFDLGIHIADVSHYVRFEDLIDQEAYARGTSVYLVDRVLPMLPEKLSNHMCSLNPHEDKLTMSVLAHISPQGQIIDYSIEDTVIRSHKRFTYEEVQGYFDGEQEGKEAARGFESTLDTLRKMAKVLNGKRQGRGALDFDLPTSRVILDDEGIPVDIQKVMRTESNRLVEEFMLLANELVAKTLRGLKRPAMFRVHEPPNETKLDELIQRIGPFGYTLYAGDEAEVGPVALQRVLHQAEGKPEEYIVHTLVLRSLMRARYDVFPLGHYGLALKDYSHFTSPIRRYPDLVVHRLLRGLSGKQKKTHTESSRAADWLDACAVHASDQERVAERAERDSVEVKKIHFMERHLGDEFDGIISGVEVFGCFVELIDFHVSGLIHINNLEDDYYQYLEDEFALLGSNTGRRFSLGDRVRVQVVSVKRELRQIDFVLVDSEETNSEKPKKHIKAPQRTKAASSPRKVARKPRKGSRGR